MKSAHSLVCLVRRLAAWRWWLLYWSVPCLLASPGQALALSAKVCVPACVLATSVVHAAGLPDALRQAAKAVRFDGDQLAASTAQAVAHLADEVKALPPKAVLTLQVKADRGLRGGAAQAQARQRAKALLGALTAAGVSPTNLKVLPG